MLVSLAIRDIVFIDQLDLEFSPRSRLVAHHLE